MTTKFVKGDEVVIHGFRPGRVLLVEEREHGPPEYLVVATEGEDKDDAYYSECELDHVRET